MVFWEKIKLGFSFMTSGGGLLWGTKPKPTAQEEQQQFACGATAAEKRPDKRTGSLDEKRDQTAAR